MSATLLTFARRQAGWDNEERALIARLERLLMGAGLAVEVELGETDEGDPWAAFCNANTGDVVVHIARLDGYYLVEAGVLGRAIEGRIRSLKKEKAHPCRLHHSKCQLLLTQKYVN
ncbi:MAG: hypothetical protein AAF968_07620 [Pseudomonadota bacterium]